MIFMLVLQKPPDDARHVTGRKKDCQSMAQTSRRNLPTGFPAPEK